MKIFSRMTAALLLAALCLPSFAGCDSSDPAPKDTVGGTIPFVSETDTQPPEVALTLDSTYSIVISAEADEITQKTADMVAKTLKEKAGAELTVITDAEEATGGELVLGHTNRAESTAAAGGYSVFVSEDSLHVDAGDSTTLYFAAEAVLETWLTEDFGLSQAGSVTLPESRVADLNGLSLRSENTLKIMTQNMRGGDDPDGNSVTKRFARFKLMLAEYQPDVIGTQEHTTNWSKRIQKELKSDETLSNYDMVGVGTGGETHILYRTDKFELLDSGVFWLSNTPDVPSVAEGVSSSFKRTCTWALLKDRETGFTFMAANTHLDHTSEILRVRQITILMNYMAEKIGDYPYFFTGDLNSTANWDTHTIVSASLTDSRTDAWVDRSTVSNSYHGYREGGWGDYVIDFVFHDEKSTPISYEILSKQYDGFVSDHYAVMVEFVLN